MHKLIEDYSPLLNLIKVRKPDIIEATAMGGVLQSFYNGVENIFKLIIRNYNESLSNTGNWYIELLYQVSKTMSLRKMVISSDVQKELVKYMKFRHTFRHRYGY